MAITWIYMIVFGIMLVAAIILAGVVLHMLKKSDSIELIQGKLENTDLSIAKAVEYLEITNEWSK